MTKQTAYRDLLATFDEDGLREYARHCWGVENEADYTVSELIEKLVGLDEAEALAGVVL